MKKQILLLSATLLGLTMFQNQNLKAQTHINQSDAPAIGNKFVVVNDTNPAVSPGPFGIAVTWTYTTLTTSTVDTIKCITVPAKYVSDFPGATMALHYSLPGIQYSFLSSNAVRLYFYGLVEASLTDTIPVEYQPAPYEYLPFTCSYESAWSGSVSYTVLIHQHARIDSIRQYVMTSYYDSVVSWGTCKTPYGSVGTIQEKQTGRDSTVTSEHDSVTRTWRVVSDTITHDTSYIWWGNRLGYPLLSMKMVGGRVKVASWLKSTTTGIDEVVDKTGTLVYPNPTNGLLTISLASCESGRLRITDITGRMILNTEFTNKNIQLSTASFASGIYFFKALDKTGNLVDIGKFVVAR